MTGPSYSDYEWVVLDDEDGEILAYKKSGEDAVFIDSEKAVFQCIRVIERITISYKNSQNLLADLSRHL